jgi:hypothetical protein
MKTIDTLKNNLQRLMKKVLYTQDAPDSIYGREWRWWPTISSKPTLNLSIEFQLTKWEGKPQPPSMIGAYNLLLYWNPLLWKIESFHQYYDGPNCHWQFGPIGFSRNGLATCSECSSNK